MRSRLHFCLGVFIILLSISFAARRKLHGFDHNFRNTTIFILHLSFIDLCYCLMVALPTCYQLLAQHWPFGTFLCKAFVIIEQLLTGTESWSLAFIAISRCLNVTKPMFWGKWTYKAPILALLLFIPWLLSLSSYLSYLLPSAGMDVGWNCQFGTCAHICNSYSGDCPEAFMLWYTIILMYTIVLPQIVVIAGYILLRRKARRSTIHLKQIGNMTTDRQKLEKKMTRTIRVLILMHCICNLSVYVYQPFYLFTFRWHMGEAGAGGRWG